MTTKDDMDAIRAVLSAVASGTGDPAYCLICEQGGDDPHADGCAVDAAIAALDRLDDLRCRTIEECAEIADDMRDKTYWDDPSAGIAATIRALLDKED